MNQTPALEVQLAITGLDILTGLENHRNDEAEGEVGARGGVRDRTIRGEGNHSGPRIPARLQVALPRLVEHSKIQRPHGNSKSGRIVLVAVLVVLTTGGLLFAFSAAKSKIGSVQTGSTTETTSQSSESPKFPSSDFLASLAASYSMTPAKFTDLPAPTAPLPSSTTAEFIKSNWPAQKAKASEFVEFVEDPLENSGDIVLSVMYPKGQYTAGEDGGTHMSLDVFGEGKTRAMLTYQVGFESNFDFVKGGKLPGLFGGDPSGKCGGGKGSESCFSARFMWREEGEGEVYTYVPLYDGLCDANKANESSVACHGDFGQSFNRGSFKFTAGQYTTLTEVAILNSNPSKDTEANGYLAVYNGETLAFERSDIVYRTNQSVFFSSIMFQTFFGGSTPDYASSVLTHTYYKNWRFFEGEEASTTEGKQVAASIGTS
ncbi:hypothetical protein JCM3765_007336 [Sporobolomyces pararoseus]